MQQLNDVIFTSYINLIGVWTATENYHTFIG